MNWPLAAILMALVAVAVPDILWGLVAVAAITMTLTALTPRGLGRRILPLAMVFVTLAAVQWIHLRVPL